MGPLGYETVPGQIGFGPLKRMVRQADRPGCLKELPFTKQQRSRPPNPLYQLLDQKLCVSR